MSALELRHFYLSIKLIAFFILSVILLRVDSKVSCTAVKYELMGMSADKIVDECPHLKLEQIHDSLSYYYEHKTALDKKYKKDQAITQLKNSIHPGCELSLRENMAEEKIEASVIEGLRRRKINMVSAAELRHRGIPGVS